MRYSNFPLFSLLLRPWQESSSSIHLPYAHSFHIHKFPHSLMKWSFHLKLRQSKSTDQLQWPNIAFQRLQLNHYVWLYNRSSSMPGADSDHRVSPQPSRPICWCPQRCLHPAVAALPYLLHFSFRGKLTVPLHVDKPAYNTYDPPGLSLSYSSPIFLKDFLGISFSRKIVMNYDPEDRVLVSSSGLQEPPTLASFIVLSTLVPND